MRVFIVTQTIFIRINLVLVRLQSKLILHWHLGGQSDYFEDVSNPTT